MNKESEPIIVEQEFEKSGVELWKAITEPDQMKQWFFENIPSFEPVIGFKTQFNVHSGERDFLHMWEIIEVIPGKKIVYNWKYKEYPGEGTVIFEIFEQGSKSLLRLTNLGIDTFPKEIPEFTGESCRQGWQYFIQNRLREYLSEMN